MSSGCAARHSFFRVIATVLFAALFGLGATSALAAPNMILTKTPANGSVTGGGVATFTISITNTAAPDETGANTSFNVEVTDPLPGVGVINWGPDPLTTQTLLFGCQIIGAFPAQQTLLCDPGSIAPGQTETVSVSGTTPDTCLVLNNTATATSTDGAGAPQTPLTAVGKITVTNNTCRPLFVIGDVEPHAVGDTVNFWGAQWWKNNDMTGLIAKGVASFKGYASDSDNFCGPGAMWESRTGNSSNPPDTIPADVMVIVTDTVQKDGPDIVGSIKQILLVHSDGGYGPAPGHRGNGTVTQVLCPTPGT